MICAVDHVVDFPFLPITTCRLGIFSDSNPINDEGAVICPCKRERLWIKEWRRMKEAGR